MDKAIFNINGRVEFFDLLGRYHITNIPYKGPYKFIGTAGIGFKSFEGVLLNNSGLFRAFDPVNPEIYFESTGHISNINDFLINKHCFISEYHDLLNSQNAYVITPNKFNVDVILWTLFNDSHLIRICPITGEVNAK